jgi:hypothetical protein
LNEKTNNTMKTLMLTITDEQADRLEERAAALHLSVQESVRGIIEQSLERTIFLPQPRQNPREGWAEAFKQMHENGDDVLLIDDVFEDETFEEWKI